MAHYSEWISHQRSDRCLCPIWKIADLPYRSSLFNHAMTVAVAIGAERECVLPFLTPMDFLRVH